MQSSKSCVQIWSVIIIINPLTARVVGAPQMILQPVFSICPFSPLPSGTCRTPGLSIPWCCLATSSFSLRYNQCFRLVIVLCRFIVRHPLLSDMDTLLHGQSEFFSLIGGGGGGGDSANECHEQNSGEGKKRAVVDNIREGWNWQNEENRSQNRSLWGPTADGALGQSCMLIVTA